MGKFAIYDRILTYAETCDDGDLSKLHAKVAQKIPVKLEEIHYLGQRKRAISEISEELKHLTERQIRRVYEELQEDFPI